jgi:hypothetical protein
VDRAQQINVIIFINKTMHSCSGLIPKYEPILEVKEFIGKIYRPRSDDMMEILTTTIEKKKIDMIAKLGEFLLKPKDVMAFLESTHGYNRGVNERRC